MVLAGETLSNESIQRLQSHLPFVPFVAEVAALAKELPDVQRRLDLFAARNSDAESAAATYRATIVTLTKSRNRNPQKQRGKLGLISRTSQSH